MKASDRRLWARSASVSTRVGRVGQGRDARGRRARATGAARDRAASGSADRSRRAAVDRVAGSAAGEHDARGRHDRRREPAAGSAGGPVRCGGVPRRCGGLGGGATGRGSVWEGGSREPRRFHLAAGVGPSGVTVRAVVSGKVHDVSTNAGTTEALLRPWGSNPTLTTASSPSPSTPLYDGMTVTGSIRSARSCAG